MSFKLRQSLLRLTLGLIALAPALCAAQVQVMVLGSYHFGNPGLDLHNAKIDDVLAPHRQRELAAVATALARYAPTLIAVEAQADKQPGRALARYAAYKSGQAAPTRNEIDQIGFRLARELQLTQVVGIDAPGDFPFEAVQNFANKAGRGEEFQRGVDALGAQSKAFEAEAKTASIGAMLRRLNQPAAIRADHGWYMQVLSYGAGSEQPGAELLGRWMMRNAAICARLVQVARPGDRVLVLYGAGHSHLLRQCVQDMPGWQLIEAVPYLP